jgi:hypothetical protein
VLKFIYTGSFLRKNVRNFRPNTATLGVATQIGLFLFVSWLSGPPMQVEKNNRCLIKKDFANVYSVSAKVTLLYNEASSLVLKSNKMKTGNAN